MNKPVYYISENNEFVIENYNTAPAFSSFFPGIAGIFGCPMWVFYANRGQCITSAGEKDKDSSIIEFQPANKAYRAASLSGFRTFLKVDNSYYEPFHHGSPFKNEMRISSHALKLVEENTKLNIRVEVNYFTIPNEDFPALARTVKITNLSRKQRKVEVIDGLPIIIPYGFSNDLLKKLSHTIEAWCIVENLDKNAPFFKLKVMPADVSETKFLEPGNFFVSFAYQDKQELPVSIIVNPQTVFGENSSFQSPDSFINTKDFKAPATQLTEGFTPSALAFKKAPLAPNGELEIFSIIGQTDNLNLLNKTKQSIAKKKYFDKKLSENISLIDNISSLMHIESAEKSFDLYSRQTFLDNTLRGGLPVSYGNKIIYLYYRKHGDMERDYNDFRLMPNYFSQGNGNYRDINQNRRNDIFINPDIAEGNIVRFSNLIQLDGFNPLVVLGSQYSIESSSVAESIIKKHIKRPKNDLPATISKPFIIGSLLKKIEESGIEFKTSKKKFAEDLLNNAVCDEVALHGEGYWIDHFSYNTDLLQSFECIYPERIKEILFSKKLFTFFDNANIVLGRNNKYYLVGGKARQYQAVQADPEKQAMINSRSHNHNIVRTDFGKGEIYYTTLLAKLLCTTANKAASFDAEGIGLEMEADKPDWYDALNGLPALFGSSLSETLELKRICEYILNHLTDTVKIDLPTEIKDFMDKINAQLKEFFQTSDCFKYWDTSYRLKEEFRHRIKLGISGKEILTNGKEAAEFLHNIIIKCNYGIKKCLEKYNNYQTYFINEVAEYEPVNGNNLAVKKFTQKPLPLFLEGFVHALKVEQDKNIPELVKNSPLYDKKLKMYKVNASLKNTPVEIGRARIFSPGWLENESIWLHMEYKYLLELLKAGMYEEFFSDFKNVLIPFTDPKKYKRSILENSSFIASSANPNENNHGRGFVARLSGASAEFIDMWLTMTTGKNIFYLNENGKVCFKLSPILPAWLFDHGRLSFKLLGAIDVTYINKREKNTFGNGVSPVSYKLIFHDDKIIEVNAPFIPEPYSLLIRERKVKEIIVTLGG